MHIKKLNRKESRFIDYVSRPNERKRYIKERLERNKISAEQSPELQRSPENATVLGKRRRTDTLSPFMAPPAKRPLTGGTGLGIIWSGAEATTQQNVLQHANFSHRAGGKQGDERDQ